MREQELNQGPQPAAEPKTPAEVPENPKNPLNVYENGYENEKENGYAKENGNDFVNSLILNDNFDEEEEYKFYEEANASAYVEKLRLQEDENKVRSFLEELEDM